LYQNNIIAKDVLKKLTCVFFKKRTPIFRSYIYGSYAKARPLVDEDVLLVGVEPLPVDLQRDFGAKSGGVGELEKRNGVSYEYFLKLRAQIFNN
jgi:hypothetical protein